MFLSYALYGAYWEDVIQILSLQHEVLIDFTREGEAILLASEWPERGYTERIMFILMDMETGRATQLWEFPADYCGMHPVMFME